MDSLDWAETAPSVVEFVKLRKTIERTAPIIRTTESAADLLAELGLRDLPHEELWVISIDGARRVHTAQRVAQGGYHDCEVSLPALLAAVLVSGTDRFLIVHNHPSGDLDVTVHDVDLTRRVAAAADLLDLRFEDHVIISDEGWVSLRVAGHFRHKEDCPPLGLSGSGRQIPKAPRQHRR